MRLKLNIEGQKSSRKGNDRLTFRCESCDNQINVGLEKLRPGNSVVCKNCSAITSIEGDDLAAEIRKIDKTLENLFK